MPLGSCSAAVLVTDIETMPVSLPTKVPEENWRLVTTGVGVGVITGVGIGVMTGIGLLPSKRVSNKIS